MYDAVKVVKLVWIDPKSPIRIMNLSRILAVEEVAICQTSFKFGSHTDNVNTAKATTLAITTYRILLNTCLSEAKIMYYFSLRASSIRDFTAE